MQPPWKFKRRKSRTDGESFMKSFARNIGVALIVVIAAHLTIAPSADAKTRWLMGGLIGAGAGVGLGVAAAVTVCNIPEGYCRKGLTYGLLPVAGGAVGFGIGALIGHAFKKEEPPADAIEVSTQQQEAFLITPTLLADPRSGTYGLGAGIYF